jgi:hypothetical protein
MPATPDEALELTEEQLTVIAQVQVDVDKHLADFYVDGRQVDVRHSIIGPLFDYEIKVLDKFISNYELAGWSITIYKDSRQGDWLSFSRT